MRKIEIQTDTTEKGNESCQRNAIEIMLHCFSPTTFDVYFRK